MADARRDRLGYGFRRSLVLGYLVVAPGALLGALAGCSQGSSSGNDGGGGNAQGQGLGGTSGNGSLALCQAGEVICSGTVARTCDGKGGVRTQTDCQTDGTRCLPGIGCGSCLPGETSCSGGVGKYCAKDGSGFVQFDCDVEQGMRCDPDGCKGGCAAPELINTYLGCDYFPTVTANPVWQGFDYAVAVANAGTAEAQVLITRGATELVREKLPAGALRVFPLPWVSELKGGDVNACQETPDPGITRLVKSGAYRVRTDQPVTVYQLSPLQYELPVGERTKGCPVSAGCAQVPAEFKSDQCFSYSNDASLLLPVNAMTGNYDVVAWPSGPNGAGTVTVTATQDHTTLHVLGRGTGVLASGAGVTADAQGTVSLDRGDVLELLAAHDPTAPGFTGDLSGTRLRASAPVQVIAGNSCANIPDPGTRDCDHVEHALFPVETLGKDYFVTVPGDLPKELVVRVSAVVGETKLKVEPAIAPGKCKERTAFCSNADSSCASGYRFDASTALADVAGTCTPPYEITLRPGEAPTELRGITQDIHLVADQPVEVAEFMVGQTAAPQGRGDPSMALAVPTAQFRQQYTFVASNTYYENWVNLVAPVGAALVLDGESIPQDRWDPLPGGEYQVARWPLPRDREVHSMQSSQPFGILVYGYGRYTSFMYVGGLDLKHITPTPIY